MTSKQRFRTALEHREADRVPILLGGTASKMYENVMREMMDFYGIPAEEMEFRAAGFRYIPVCEKLYDYLGVDVRMVQPCSYSKEVLAAQMSGGTIETHWGSKFKFNDSAGEWVQVGVDPPFAEADIGRLRDFKWPRPGKELTEGLRKEAIRLSCENKYALGLYRVLEAGVFGTSHSYLCGMEPFLCILMEEPGFAEEMMKGILETQKAYYGVVLDEIGDLLDYVEIEEDLGMQTGPLIDPRLFRKMIKPLHKELVQFIKSKCPPETRVLIHSDGAIREFIPDFIECGIDILNPVQVGPAGMDLQALKRDFGKDIVFDGGVDAQKPFYGAEQDVKDAVKRTIDALAPGGGYILGPTHNFSHDIPMKNILTMVEFAKEYGCY
jgi:uroporphyrinogen decarboxylase